mgnify:CR=1 FL=1
MIETNGENILWNNFKEGKPNSFRPLFEYFYPSLCEYAFQIIGDKMDAEDVVLDLFIFIWKNSDRINIGKSIRSYLFISVKLIIFRNIKPHPREHFLYFFIKFVIFINEFLQFRTWT